jgi:hypothetical protein
MVAQNDVAPTAQLTLRVPARAAHGLLDTLARVGTVRHRQLAVKDVGKQYYDATLRLRNLEALRARYEGILERADKVADILQVERELNSVLERIETLKGELRWLRDRAARATIHVTLVGPRKESAAPTAGHADAKLYPGARLVYLADFWRDTGNARYWGAGVSVRFSRHFCIDLDGLRATGTHGRGLDLLLLTLGGELYSDYLGGGKRSFLNPYIGFRAGYARVLSENEVAVGGTVGVELVKGRAATVDLESRVLGILGSDEGAHLALEPGLGLNVAF